MRSVSFERGNLLITIERFNKCIIADALTENRGGDPGDERVAGIAEITLESVRTTSPCAAPFGAAEWIFTIPDLRPPLLSRQPPAFS
jgi:hypothetical protein